MKISELIKDAQDLLLEHGDLEVNIFMKCLDGIHDGYYPLELVHTKSYYGEKFIEGKSSVKDPLLK